MGLILRRDAAKSGRLKVSDETGNSTFSSGKRFVPPLRKTERDSRFFRKIDKFLLGYTTHVQIIYEDSKNLVQTNFPGNFYIQNSKAATK